MLLIIGKASDNNTKRKLRHEIETEQNEEYKLTLGLVDVCRRVNCINETQCAQ